jgi:hypothetical protein
MDIHPEGRTYTERYQVMDYPHVGIIDPRTGRLMWRKEGWTQENPLTAETFAEYAMDFCSRNSFDRPPSAPRAAAALPTKRPAREMSEEEQLKAAMRASMEDATPAAADTKNDDDNDNNSVEYIADSDDEDDEENDVKQGASAVPEEKPKSVHDELVAMAIGDEPAIGARIQFRMPDGKRVVRKFAETDTVQTVYAFVAVRKEIVLLQCHSCIAFLTRLSFFLYSKQQTNEEARGGKEFVLMVGFPPSDLANNDLEKDTIEGCKLSGQAVTVRWKA